MTNIYFTITGTSHYFGQEIFEKGMVVKLVKEPDNKFDKEAIKVELEGLGLVGYVANSAYSVQGESYSAGRMYDKVGNEATGTVAYVLPKGVLCALNAPEPEMKKAEPKKEERKRVKHRVRRK